MKNFKGVIFCKKQKEKKTMSFSQKIARFFTSVGVGIKDFFVNLPVDIAKGVVKCIKAIGRFFINFHKRLVDLLYLILLIKDSLMEV